MKELMYSIAVLALAFFSSGVCARNSTYLSLTTNGVSTPGQVVKVSATLSGGPFLVSDPNGGGGGTITFLDNTTVIGSVKISPATAQNVYVFKDSVPIVHTDGSVSYVLFSYLLSKLSTVSINYALSNKSESHTLTARFDVDDRFSEHSSSAPLLVDARYGNVNQAISFLLD